MAPHLTRNGDRPFVCILDRAVIQIYLLPTIDVSFLASEY
jgi:hypothetical protein